MQSTQSHTSAEKLPRQKRILFTLIVSFGTFFICFGIMEVMARLTQPRVDLYAVTGRVPGPNPMASWALIDAFSAYRGKPGNYSEGKTVNRHGFISTPAITLEKPPGTRRLVFLGESSTAGTGWNLPDNLTWPWRTVEWLRRGQPETQLDFINGALGGYTSLESFGLFWSRLIHFKPDIVILNHGWNEMYYFGQADDMTAWRTLPDGSWGFAKTRRPVPLYKPKRYDPLIRWSRLLTVVRLSMSDINRGEIAPPVQQALANTFNQGGLDIWRTQLKLFRETCRALGIHLFVIKQPTLIIADLPAALKQRCRYDFHGFNHDAHVAAYAAIYKIIDEEIPADAIIDLTSLSGNPDYFFDHVHPNPAGTRAIASRVAAFLESRLIRSITGDG